jgi:hypothetical protein
MNRWSALASNFRGSEVVGGQIGTVCSGAGVELRESFTRSVLGDALVADDSSAQPDQPGDCGVAIIAAGFLQGFVKLVPTIAGVATPLSAPT